ncbi:MAG: hypothetical protein ACQGVK_11000 [Myxococcota bacterium]
MNENFVQSTARAPGAASSCPDPGSQAWHTPSVEVISLSCEISAYAPDEDGWPPF